MKIFLIFLFTLIGMTFINFQMDLATGMEQKKAIENMLNPFWVVTPFGFLLMTGLFAWFFLHPLITFIKKKKRRS